MAGHTPGPWRYHHDKYEGDAILSSSKPVCWVVRRYEDPDTGYYVVDIPNEANARLIAAAPDLLVALVATLRFIENTEGELGITLDSGDLARAAIAKATQGGEA